MPEYIYLLENRLTLAQQHALKQVRDAAREAGLTIFLAGGAVRDLTTGSSVRNLDFSVQGNVLPLQEALGARGGELWGVHEATRTLTFWFPGIVRVQVASARTEEYPKPGKPVIHWSTIVEDLRRRDFTANAMALSLNEGSYGLLLDPLNGVADIEARLLRLATNYGFIEEPSRLIRATRLVTRLGWQMDDKTATRYANAKEAESIKVLSPYLRGCELERVASEEDALGTMRALEAEGWMEHLQPGWTSAKADVAGMDNLRRNWIQLLMQGVTADLTAAHLELLTAKLEAKDRDGLKKAMVHPGLLRQWESLDEHAKEFGRQLTGKGAATASATWKLLTTQPAEPILWLAHTRKAGSAADLKFKNFFTVWPEFKKKVPAALMLEMRITPELPGYAELLEQLFYQLIDGNLETEEALRAFLEPWSPPAPPPPPTVRRSRAKKSESKTKRRTAAPEDDDEEEDRDSDDEDEAEADADSEADGDADADEVDADAAEEEEEPEDSNSAGRLGKILDTDVLAGDSDAEEDAGDEDEDAGAGSPRVKAAPLGEKQPVRAGAAGRKAESAAGASAKPAGGEEKPGGVKKAGKAAAGKPAIAEVLRGKSLAPAAALGTGPAAALGTGPAAATVAGPAVATLAGPAAATVAGPVAATPAGPAAATVAATPAAKGVASGKKAVAPTPAPPAHKPLAQARAVQTTPAPAAAASKPDGASKPAGKAVLVEVQAVAGSSKAVHGKAAPAKAAPAAPDKGKNAAPAPGKPVRKR